MAIIYLLVYMKMYLHIEIADKNRVQLLNINISQIYTKFISHIANIQCKQYIYIKYRFVLLYIFGSSMCEEYKMKICVQLQVHLCYNRADHKIHIHICTLHRFVNIIVWSGEYKMCATSVSVCACVWCGQKQVECCNLNYGVSDI